ncbi:MAG: hypothetical protein A3K59_01495 [Euryarchaeota archaeon RBG_19FT_COMBO_69_17]|nr:MAG: hypothetical protein A3K59_01495 [Euryarchaeota archaeon RBG_19FT_COMBO_69_17]
MDVIQVLTEPLVIIAIAIGVFTLRVIYLAKRLKTASKDLTFADLRALDEAKKGLNAHKDSLEVARETLQENLGGARDTLRHYDAPFTKTVEDRRKGIESVMDDLEKSRSGYKDEYRRGIKEARKIVRDAFPRKTHRAPKDL